MPALASLLSQDDLALVASVLADENASILEGLDSLRHGVHMELLELQYASGIRGYVEAGRYQWNSCGLLRLVRSGLVRSQ